MKMMRAEEGERKNIRIFLKIIIYKRFDEA